MCESFPPPGQAVLARSIGSVSWHVTYYNGCEKDHRFEVRFYRGLSNPNRPDIFNPVATYIVGPGVVREVGWVTGWGEPSKRLELAARLDPPFDPALIGGQGWFSIVSVAIGGQSCYALLGSANEGDGVHWLQRSFGGGTETGDVHYCLGGTARGACCDDRTTECTDDELQFVCSLQGRRVGSEACQDLAPPCGLMPGACCLGDETCRENQTRAECESVPGAHWRGPGTTCAECRWVHCLPGAHVEIEPCGQSTNGGCTVEPATFETIAAGGVVCGTAWADGGQRDEDWYEFVLLQSTESLVIQSVEVEVPVRITFYYAHDYYGWCPPACDQLTEFVSSVYAPSVPGPALPTPWRLPRGRYWIRVAPEDLNGPVLHGHPCNTANDYQLEVVVEYATCPNPCNIPGAIIFEEGEPDYCINAQPDTFNAGCDQFLAPPGPSLYITDNFEICCADSGWYDLPAVICPGDLNCDDFVDFADINPFVLALANWPAWRSRFPNCPPRNADINGDGMYGGPRGFGDINAFVRLLANGGGQPIACSHAPVSTPDYDWWEFRVWNSSPRSARMFFFSEFPLTWELYSQAAGCHTAPLERHPVFPCDARSVPTRCLAPGWYWVRVIPAPGVECGKEYAIGIEEFLGCNPCHVTCQPADTPENEVCGQHVNDTCGAAAMPIPDPYWPNQSVVCGTTYSLLQPEESDEDWYRFDIPSGENQYLVVVLNGEIELTPWITIQGCQGLGWLPAWPIRCDPGGELRGFYIDKAHIPGGSHVDLRITPRTWDSATGWQPNPIHAPCETTYRLIAGYSPTEPRDEDFGIRFEKLTFSAPCPP